MESNIFKPMEIDAIGEILNISLGASATAVSTMLGKRVDITTPDVKVVSFDEFEYSDMEPAIGVEITYVSGLSGSNIMLLKRHDVKVIVELLMGTQISDEEFELNEMNMSAICEVMNQMMGSSSTALSEFLGEVVNISTPVSFEIKDAKAFKEKCFGGEKEMVVANFQLKIENLIESRFMNLMPIQLAKKLLSPFGLNTETEEKKKSIPNSPSKQPAPAAVAEEAAGSNGVLSQEEIEKLLQSSHLTAQSRQQNAIDIAVANAGIQQKPSAVPENSQSQPSVNVPSTAPIVTGASAMQAAAVPMQPEMRDIRSAPRVIETQPLDLNEFSVSDQIGKEQAENLALIMDVPLEISVEIGRTKKLIKDILELTVGSLVVLNKSAGDQVDIYANGQCIAKGDVVVVDDNFGVRITEIIKRDELFKK